MLSGSIDDASSVMFSRASSTNVFNKVFRNNMDDNSFNGDNQRQIDLIMSESETAYFISTGMVRNSYEYKSCKVYLVVIRLKKQYHTFLEKLRNYSIQNK